MAAHNLETVRAGIRSHYREHGKVPSALSGDAEPHLGYRTTWSAVNGWARTRGHGSLAQLCRNLGLGAQADHDVASIRAGIERYREEHRGYPSQRSGDATRYVGYRTSWRAIDMWLRRRGARLSSPL